MSRKIYLYKILEVNKWIEKIDWKKVWQLEEYLKFWLWDLKKKYEEIKKYYFMIKGRLKRKKYWLNPKFIIWNKTK